MGAETPERAAYEDGLRAMLAEVTREHALLVRYLGPSATQAALSGLEPRDVVLDEAAQEPKPAPGARPASMLQPVDFDDEPELVTADYREEVGRLVVDRARCAEALQRIVDAVAAGDAAAVDKLARNALGLTRIGRPGPFQPAPDLEAAFANGMRVRTGPCTVEAHDREHFQVRTNGHWLCGHLLASVLTVQGIVAATRDQTADATAEGDDVPDEVRDLGRSLGASGWAKVPGPDGMELAVEAGWEIVRFDVTPAAPQPAPELAEPVTVAGVLCRDYPSVVAAMSAEVDRRRFVFLRVEAERDQLREAHERQRLELLQAQGEAAETAAELVRVKQLHAGLLGEVKPNGGGYSFRTTGVLLARRYAAANLPVRDDLSKLAGQ